MRATMSFSKTYEEKVKAQKEACFNSSITEMLEMKSISNKKLQEIMDKMSKITGKPVYEDFSYRSGKILGILRHMLQNPKQRQELCEVTGLNSAYVDLYYQVVGNLPYVSTKNGQLVLGREQDCEATKELVRAAGSTMGVLVEDSDLQDINPERWQRLYEAALEDAKNTIAFNEANGDIAYDE